MVSTCTKATPVKRKQVGAVETIGSCKEGLNRRKDGLKGVGMFRRHADV